MPRILEGWIFSPLHFNRREPAALFDDEIHLGSIAGALMVQPARTEVLEAVPQLDADPLFNRALW